MTRIDFYSLQQDSNGDRFLLTCRLLETIHKRGLRVYIHTPDPVQAQHLDRLLWTYDQGSFLPHGLVGRTDRTLTPILIGHDEGPSEEDQVLINLGLEVPTFLERFERLCEPVDNDPAVRSAARRRFRYYRDRGYALHHNDIRL